MKITLPITRPSFDDDRITYEIQKDFDNECQIYVFKDEFDWVDDETTHAFSVWVEYGSNKKNTVMFETGLDDLEMFANSILKSVEMLRRDYSDVLKEKIKNGALL